jgi:hypothetical protein
MDVVPVRAASLRSGSGGRPGQWLGLMAALSWPHISAAYVSYRRPWCQVTYLVALTRGVVMPLRTRVRVAGVPFEGGWDGAPIFRVSRSLL